MPQRKKPLSRAEVKGTGPEGHTGKDLRGYFSAVSTKAAAACDATARAQAAKQRAKRAFEVAKADRSEHFSKYLLTDGTDDNAVRDNAEQHIFVKTTAGRTFQVGITGDCDTVDDIKAVCKKAEILPAQHRLVFAGKALEGGNLLADYNICKGSTVRVLPRMRGGGVQDNINVANPMLDEVEDEDNVVEAADQLAERAEQLEKQNARAEEADGIVKDEATNRAAEIAGDQGAEVPVVSAEGSEELPAGGCALLEGTGTLEGVLYVCESSHSLPFSFTYVRSASMVVVGDAIYTNPH